MAKANGARMQGIEKKGTVVSVNLSETTGVKKVNVHKAVLLPAQGFEGDAHSGPWHRQVSLLALESIDKMRCKGLDVHPGDFAENVTTKGLALAELPLGARIRIGDKVLLEVTQIGKTCHSGCAIFQQVGECIMPKEGIFARVLEGGQVGVQDAISVEE